MTTEAAFLSNRRERSERLVRNRADKSVKEEAMAEMQDQLRQWKLGFDRVTSILAKEAASPADHFATELSKLSDELAQINQSCASNELLSIADVNLLHRQLTECQVQLTETRMRHKPKFIFRRYRQAMEAQRNKPVLPVVSCQEAQEEPKETKLPEDPRCLSNITHADICISSATGEITITPNDNKEQQETRELPNLQALKIHSVTHCKVTLHGDSQSLVLQNISDSSFTILDSATTLHVTDCHRIRIQSARTQQVRLHQSDFVDLFAESAVMLEECQSVVVYGAHVQVNDFQWLRTDQPSPNYTHVVVVESKQDDSCEPKETTIATRKVQNASQVTTQSSGSVPPSEVVDDDDDEEL